MERPTDQEIKDRQQEELAEERRVRAERLGHDIRDIEIPKSGPSKNELDSAK